MPKTLPSIMRPGARPRRRPEPRGLTGSAAVTGGLALWSPTVAGIGVTPSVALTFTAVYAAINVISRDFASLPPAVYRRKRGGGRTVVYSHSAHDRLNYDPDPSNPRSNALRLRQSLMGHNLGWGGGYWRIKRFGDGEIDGFTLLSPATTRPKETKSGRLYYQVSGNDSGYGDEEKLLPENVFHLAGLGFDGVTGYSPIAMAREAIGMGKAAEQFGASLFGNGAIPKGILKTSKRLTATGAQNLRESWNAMHGGSGRANGTAVLEEGTDWINTQINPDDAQFLATRQFQVLEIARIFSIPPHKIGDYSQSHLANVEESNLDYLTTTLAGWVEAFEYEANLKLLSEDERRRGLYIGHDMTRLLRGNMAARTTYYEKMRNLGAMNAAQIALRENLPPPSEEEGGNKYLVNGAYTTLAAAGEPKPEPTPPEPVAPDDAPEPPGSLDEPGDGDEPSQ